MMRIMGYNLCMSEQAPDHLYKDRAAGLETLVEKYDPDVLGVQEVTPPWLALLEQHFGDRYEIWNKYRSSTNFEGTPILWKKEKYECLDKGYFWLSDTPDLESQGWDSYRCNRICMWAKLRDRETGDTFVHFNTHYGFSDYCHMESTKLIAAHIREMKLPAFITADFNFTVNSAGYREMISRFGDVDADTVQDESTTFNNYNLEWKGARIDFCFYTRDTIVPLDYKRLDERPNDRFISDHYGTLYDIRFRTAVSAAALDLGAEYPVTENAEERARWIYSVMRETDPDVLAFRNATPALAAYYEKRRKWGGTDPADSPAIYWKKDVFEAEEACRTAGAAALLLRHKETGKKLLCCNLQSGEAIDWLRKTREQFAAVPALLFCGLENGIGSAEYRALRELGADLRAELEPARFDHTELGFEEGFSAPRITDFIFVDGENAHPLAYKVGEGVSGRNRVSAHRPLAGKIALD